MKVLTVIGARPQFIKAGPVSAALRNAGIEEVLVHTGQHYDPSMSQVFFDELGLPEPAINLNVGSGMHGEQTGAMLSGLEKAILAERPDWVLIYGDTNSTLAGALAAVKLHVSVAHVEAGLRSFNRAMPEEINRIVADAVSHLLFAPTATALRNLVAEGVSRDRIVECGDVMYDAALVYGTRSEKSDVLQRLNLEPKGYVLATVHRAENTDNPERLQAILDGLRRTAEAINVVLPVHPRTRKALESAPALHSGKNLRLIEPLGYLDMLQLQRNAAVIATDSGGVQKEAFFCGVPCVTLRDETEWTELVELGWNTLCPPRDGASMAEIILSCRGRAGHPGTPYGDGNAAKKVVDGLLSKSAGSVTCA